MKKKYFMIIVFISIGFYILINTFLKSRKEYRTTYNFVITKIEVTPTYSLEFFDKSEKIVIWNYIISGNQGVEIGDSIYKKKCSKYLYIYKKNNNGKYEIYLKVSPSGLFPYEWFCD